MAIDTAMIEQNRKQGFTPTKGMLITAKTVFFAMAHLETIKPIVRGYHQKVLDNLNPRPVSQFTGEEIADIDHAWEMRDDVFTEYDYKCRDERDKAGLHVDSPDQCPLLVAEDILRQAKALFVDAMKPITTIGHDDLRCHPNLYDELVETSLRLIAPYMSTKPDFKF